MTSRPSIILYRVLLKRAKLYGDLVSKRQLGAAKELSALCSRVGAGSEILDKLDSKLSVCNLLQKEIKKEFQQRAHDTDPQTIQADLSKGFLTLRAINERLNFLSVLPDSTISSTTTHYANIQIESYCISVTTSKRPRGQSIGKDPTRAYTFAYKVTISHTGPQDAPPFRVKSRRWVLTNENEDVEVVEGDGVVGKHPRLCAGEAFVYTSHCTVSTPLGVMKGHFVLYDEVKNSLFEAEISPIRLDVRVVPSKEQAEDIETIAQAHAIPIRYSSATTPEKVNAE
jgi:ApaG protein